MHLAFIGGLGGPELIVILIVALLLFGSRLPKVMRSLGQSINEFKRGMHDVVSDEPVGGETDAQTPAKKDEAAV